MISITAPTTSSASFRLVKNIRIRPPVSVTRLRSASEAEEPTTVWIKVVSAVSRDSTSPVRVTSKKAGRQAQHIVEHRLADVGHHPLAQPGDEIKARRRGQAPAPPPPRRRRDNNGRGPAA